MSTPGFITVSTQVYEAKLDDSYALGKIFSHLVHVCEIGSDSGGKRPEAVVIDYIESLRDQAKCGSTNSMQLIEFLTWLEDVSNPQSPIKWGNKAALAQGFLSSEGQSSRRTDRINAIDSLVGDMQGLAMEVCTTSKPYEGIISEMTETLLGVGITEDELDAAGWGLKR